MMPTRFADKGSLAIAAILTMVFLSPIWVVDRFIMQDASGHVTTSFVMAEMLRGNQFFLDFYKFNSPFIPNASGHWLMVVLLKVFSGFTVTKIMASLTFVTVPASVVWLRWQVAGREGWLSTFLIGSAVAFNWFWLLGTFNFLLGLVGCIFTFGLYWRWKDSLTVFRCIVIVLLVAFVYFSHLVGFFILAGGIPIIALLGRVEDRRRTILWTLPIMASIAALLIIYKIEISSVGHAYFPVWQALKESYSLRNVLTHFIAVDPFVLISRRTLPFTNFDSIYLAVFSPFVWLCLAVVFFAIGTVSKKARAIVDLSKLPFLLLSFGALFMALFGPDDFNLMNGGLMRQRLFIASFLLMTPLFVFSKASRSNTIGHLCLAFVLLFQTVAMYEFAIRSNDETRDFMAVSSSIPDGQRIASTVVLPEPARFHAFPPAQMNNYLGIGRNLIVMDNYEMGHNLFSIVTRDPEMQKFILGLTSSTAIYLTDPREDLAGDLRDLDFYLSANSGKIDVMLLYGRNEAVESILRKTFEAQPFVESGKIRVFNRIK